MPTAASCLEMKIFSPLEIAFAKKILTSIEKENEEEALFLSYLFAASIEGHLCVAYKEKLVPSPSFLWDRPSCEEVRVTESCLEEKIIRGLHKILSKKEGQNGALSDAICVEESRVYLQRNHFFETKIASSFARLLQAKPADLFLREKFLYELQQRQERGFLLEEQRESIEKSLTLSLSLIVGGPGTGKTYTAAEMISLFSACFNREKKKKLRIALAAPTGRAAEHLKQAVGKRCALDCAEAIFLTLHSLLKIHEGHAWPLEQRPQMADLIIVDEASMIDPRLMACLLDSLPSSSRLVLMGDAHQLPAVEGGSIFAEMAKKKSFRGRSFSTLLKHAVRFENEAIVRFSQDILEGRSEEAFVENQKGVSFHFVEEERKMREEFFDLGGGFFMPPFVGKVDVEGCFAFLHRFRLLCPLRNSLLGTHVLNRMFFQELMKRLSFGEEAFFPILMTRNDPDNKISNGTLGMVHFVFRGEKNPFLPTDPVYFWDGEGNKLRTLPLCALGPFEAGFCLSVHKSQGSEFSEVFLLLPPGCERFGKEMLYTAATRAKKTLFMIGRKKTIEELFKRGSLKSSGLLKKLQDCEHLSVPL